MNGQYPGIEPDRKPEDSLKFPRSETKKRKIVSLKIVKMETSSNSSFLEERNTDAIGEVHLSIRCKFVQRNLPVSVQISL